MIEQTCGENLEHESGTLRSLRDRETILPLAWSVGEGNLKKRCDCGLPGSRLVDCEIWPQPRWFPVDMDPTWSPVQIRTVATPWDSPD